MDRGALFAQLHDLLPLAAQWAAEEERRALRDGVSLSPGEMVDAHSVGVQSPERVRLLQVEEIPAPTHPQLRAAADAIHFLTPETRGLTLHYGIFVRCDCWGKRPLVLHELAHTAQYERMGGILPFLEQYLSECLTIGYANAPMEVEAASVAARIMDSK